MRRSGAIKCKGGIPTSFEDSGQQWDFPNAWPPLQHILVAGLLKTGNPVARRMALIIARRYTVGTMFSCPDGAEVCNMFEKVSPAQIISKLFILQSGFLQYNVNDAGSAGGGGEYEVQTGFGWTNGVVIDFLVTFGDELLDDDDQDEFLEVLAKADDEQVPLLSSHFDITDGKSKVRSSRWSAVSKAIAAHIGLKINQEKHETEKSEKSLVHPVLAIEEDDDGKCEK